MINFAERSFTLQINGKCTKIGVISIKETTNKLGGIEESSSENKFRSFGLESNFPLKLLSLTADPRQHRTDPIMTVKEDALIKNEKGGS